MFLRRLISFYFNFILIFILIKYLIKFESYTFLLILIGNEKANSN